jgi:chemotaxis protein methyltransferase CheR
LIYQAAGIELGPGKETLVISRLTKKLRETGCRTFEAYLRLVSADDDARTGLIDALTTNYTAFFREPGHFEFLRQTILPAFQDKGTFTVWCAAAATGEEPYSLAMTLMEVFGSAASTRAGVLATDISTRALARARRAVYPAAAFSQMAPEWMPKYLLRGVGPQDGYFQIRPEVTRMVRFGHLNLVEEFSHPAPFSLICCRNVMIYFDRATQERLVQRLTRFLEPGGYLYIGHAESLTAIRHSLQYVHPAIYRKSLAEPVRGAQ